MKRICLLFMLLTSGAFMLNVAAQQPGVAINADGSAPHNSAMLDVQSTSKGFLLPRMTQAQRLAISNPEPGLLVFDTDFQRLYQYQNGTWRFLIDNSYWAGSTSRNWVYNGGDSVGIGSASPTERLQVNGNIRVLNGDVKIDAGDITINNSSGILQLQAAGESKGFVQLSGNDLRIGTNLGNTDGNLIIRTQGANQVTVSQQGLELTSNGKLLRSSTGANNMLPVCYGQIRADGSVIHSTPNATVEKIGVGIYIIRFSGMSVQSTTLITPMNANVRVATTYVPDPGWGVYVEFRNAATGATQDAAFSFLIFNP